MNAKTSGIIFYISVAALLLVIITGSNAFPFRKRRNPNVAYPPNNAYGAGYGEPYQAYPPQAYNVGPNHASHPMGHVNGPYNEPLYANQYAAPLHTQHLNSGPHLGQNHYVAPGHNGLGSGSGPASAAAAAAAAVNGGNQDGHQLAPTFLPNHHGRYAHEDGYGYEVQHAPRAHHGSASAVASASATTASF